LTLRSFVRSFVRSVGWLIDCFIFFSPFNENFWWQVIVVVALRPMLFY